MLSAKICLLALGCLCRAGACLGQQAPVVPLAPVTPAVAPPAPRLGVEIQAKQPAASAATPLHSSPWVARSNWPQPVYLVNSRIIVNGLSTINPQDIADIHVYKGPDAPVRWQSLTENGIIDITLKPGVRLKLKTRSLAAIRRQARASGLVGFKLNGLPISDNSLRVAATAIAELDVVRDEMGTVINICLAPPQSTPPNKYPPGTIMIRGVAQQ